MTCAITLRTQRKELNDSPHVNENVSVSQRVSKACCARWRSRYWNPIHFWRPLATLEPSGACWRRSPNRPPTDPQFREFGILAETNHGNIWKQIGNKSETNRKHMETYANMRTTINRHQTTCPHCPNCSTDRYCILSALHIFAYLCIMATAHRPGTTTPAALGNSLSCSFAPVARPEKHGAC